MERGGGFGRPSRELVTLGIIILPSFTFAFVQFILLIQYYTQ